MRGAFVGLADRLNSMKPKQSGLPCSMGLALTQMSNDDRAMVEDALFAEPRTLSNVQLVEALQEEGYDVTYSAVSLHRRKSCRCFIGRQTRTASN